MDVYTHVNMDAKRGAAGAVPEMFWARGRRPLDSAARLWYTGIGDPKRMASKCRGLFPRLFSYLRGLSLRGLSRPVGESGSDNLRDEHYLLALVLHEQSDSITHEIERYEQSLRDKGLPGISLHSGLLLTGHEGYEGMPLADRKRLLSSSVSSSATCPCATSAPRSGSRSTETWGMWRRPCVAAQQTSSSTASRDTTQGKIIWIVIVCAAR